MAIKIGLDAGHGLNTSGKQTPNGVKEWALNDKVRDKVVSFLSAYDCEIVHTDNDEGATDESLTSRLNKYRNAGVSAFVSIHHNAYTGTWNTATGVEVYTDQKPTAKDTQLATMIYNRLVSNTGLKGRGIKKAAFTVINQNSIPAVLVEGGFMDGSNDYKVITSDAGQTAYAKAVAEGLIEFLGLKKKVTPTVKPAATTTKKTVEEIAREVIAGKWGNGSDRKARLIAAGYNYSAIQSKVNELCGKKTPTATTTAKPAAKPAATPKVQYYARYFGSSGSIVTALNSLKIGSSFANRKKIAKANGIKNYLGTASQNITLLNLLKIGKLIKP